MAKRLNPRRRLIAQLREWESQERSLRTAYNDEPLQKGNVRSSMFNPTRARAWIATQAKSMRAPRLLWENGGKAGKSVKGNLVRPKGKPQFQGVGVNQPTDVENFDRTRVRKGAEPVAQVSAPLMKANSTSKLVAKSRLEKKWGIKVD